MFHSNGLSLFLASARESSRDMDEFCAVAEWNSVDYSVIWAIFRDSRFDCRSRNKHCDLINLMNNFFVMIIWQTYLWMTRVDVDAIVFVFNTQLYFNSYIHWIFWCRIFLDFFFLANSNPSSFKSNEHEMLFKFWIGSVQRLSCWIHFVINSTISLHVQCAHLQWKEEQRSAN